MPKRVRVTGDKALLNLLRELPKKIETKVNRQAVTKATTPILNAVKDECPVEHGDLRNAQIKKITNRGMQSNGIVGADANYVGQDGVLPSKYDHLVTYGHLTPNGTITAANPYMQRGFDRSIGEAQETYTDTMESGIEKEAAKLGNS